MDFIAAIESAIDRPIEKIMMPLQAGDVPATFANVDDLVEELDYRPATPVQQGINQFVAWYRDFFNV